MKLKYVAGLLIYIPWVLACVIWWNGGHLYWGLLEWAVLTPIIMGCLWKHYFGSWKFWRMK